MPQSQYVISRKTKQLNPLIWGNYTSCSAPMNALFYLIKKLFRAAKWWKKWNSMPEWHEMKCCSVRLFAIRETTKIFVSLSAARSVRLRLFQNWNSLCCKCQAFITHNLFISLHIKLVMFFFCIYGNRESGMHAGSGIDCTSHSFPVCAITFSICGCMSMSFMWSFLLS